MYIRRGMEQLLCSYLGETRIRSRETSNWPRDLYLIGEHEMPDDDTKWDIVDYLDTIRDAGGYLEA